MAINKKIALLIAILVAAETLAGCGSKAPDVTVIGNSSSQEKTASPTPSK